MKKIIATVILLAAVIGIALYMSENGEATKADDAIRIHIRANSNSEIDQTVKMAVVEQVVQTLTPKLAQCNGRAEALSAINSALPAVKSAADNVLAELGFSYRATVSLRKEQFPVRKYGDFLFPDGVYDALIVELGEGTGDNWWCVAFPPLCFIPESEGDFYYKSKIVEIIESYKEKKEVTNEK